MASTDGLCPTPYYPQIREYVNGLKEMWGIKIKEWDILI